MNLLYLSIYPIGSLSLDNPDQPSGRAWVPMDQVWGAQFQQTLGWCLMDPKYQRLRLSEPLGVWSGALFLLFQPHLNSPRFFPEKGECK